MEAYCVAPSTWEDLVQIKRTITTSVFRGHSDANWGLKPSLERALRPFPQLEWLLENREDWLLKQFSRVAHLHGVGESTLSDPLASLAVMQHYGAPTRLLDVTHSFYMALFFAAESLAETTCVWAFNTGPLCAHVLRADPASTKDEVMVSDYFEGNYSYAKDVLANSSRADAVVPVEGRRLSEREKLQRALYLMACNGKKPFEDCLRATYDLEGVDIAHPPQSPSSSSVGSPSMRRQWLSSR